MDLLSRVQAYIEEHDLFAPGATLVLGVSGGPDSLCLLDVFQRLSADWRLSLHVAHLNHGLRAEAAAEAEFVRAEAEQRGLPFHTETADVRAHAHRAKQSIEEAARHRRYDFLARRAQAAQASALAVAHTADDQAETVLMHFLRGSGLAGLRGMRPKMEMRSWMSEVRGGVPLTSDLQPPTSISLIRPLLSITRAEVEAYCAERGLRPVQDATNADTTYFRNRLRHELLPELQTYNPNLRAVLGRMAEVAAGEYELLTATIDALWKRMARASLQVEFDRTRWLTLTAPEQRALLRRAIHYLRAEERDVDFAPLERAVRFSRAEPGRHCDVLSGLELKITGTAVVLRERGYQPQRADLPLLDARGQLAPGWRFDVEPAPVAIPPAETWRVVVDAALLPGPLTLRARWPGAWFQPLGLGGHRVKLSDFMINAKVDEALRDRWPLVVCGDDIVWVAGLRLDERFCLTAATHTAYQLSFSLTADT